VFMKSLQFLATISCTAQRAELKIWSRTIGTGSSMMGNNILEEFNTYGWRPNSSLAEDENMMDLTLLVTRSSKLKQGSMACILLRDRESNDDESDILGDRIIAVANNQALYTENESDVHAEIAAIGEAAASGRAVKNCTAYITMPPCKNCFGALLSAGVKRIVSRRPTRNPALLQVAREKGVSMLSVPDITVLNQRVNAIVQRFEQSQMADTVAEN
jgi:deoxycytidylate deaminase